MTQLTTVGPIQDPTCRQCGHGMDGHVLVLVREQPAPMGLIYCPEPGGCNCGSTWRANVGPSTPEQIEETRTLVRQTLVEDGYPVPAWLV